MDKKISEMKKRHSFDDLMVGSHMYGLNISYFDEEEERPNQNLESEEEKIDREIRDLHEVDLRELMKKLSDTNHLINDITELLTISFMNKDQNEITLKEILTFIRYLKYFEQQNSCVIDVINAGNETEIKKIDEIYQQLGQFCLKIRSKAELNDKMLSMVDGFVRERIFKRVFKKFSDLVAKPKKATIASEQEFLDYLTNMRSKLECTVEFYPFVVTFNKTDLFSLPNEHPEWQAMRKIMRKYELNNSRTMQNSINGLMKYLYIANAVLIENSGDRENQALLKRGYNIGKDAVYYLFKSNEAETRTKLFLSNPHPETAIKFWNLPDTKALRKFIKLTYPWITFSKKIYVPRLFDPITLEDILSEYEKGTLNKTDMIKKFYTKGKENYDEVFQLAFQKDASKIPVRILANKNLSKGPFINLKRLWGSNPAYITDILIIHIHGGGFVSMSSRSHQNYTRKWAKELNCPIFSIDYRLAPDHPYPAALDDCWQAYNWLLENAFNLFGVKPRKILLIGDSAGGNLITGITIKSIKSGFRIPDGLFLVYPALNLSLSEFTPSYLMAFENDILPHTFLKLCVSSYLSDPRLRPQEDPFISPIKVSPEILSLFPPVMIVAATRDPLHDDNFRFAQRLNNLGKSVEIVDFVDMPHGFLNMNYPGGLKETNVCLDEASNMIKRMIDKMNSD